MSIGINSSGARGTSKMTSFAGSTIALSFSSPRVVNAMIEPARALTS